MSDANNYINTKFITEWLSFLSHLIFAIIVILCLRKYNPIITFIILSGILLYICYLTKNQLPVYIIPLIGLCMFLINIFLKKMEVNINNDNNNDTNIKNCTWVEYFKNNIWILPFMGILAYYSLLILFFYIDIKHIYN